MSAEEQINDRIHRLLAIRLFNATWELIDTNERSVEENDAMISGAHASLYHWSQVGGPEQLTVGHWQVAHVYTLLRQGQSALYHATRCLEICAANGIGDWRLAFAYEAVARAYAANGSPESCRDYHTKAVEAGVQISATGEREHFLSELAKEPWYGCDLTAMSLNRR